MKELTIEKTMTVKEIAGLFHCAENTVLNAVKVWYPGIVRNGLTTKLNQEQITAIKKEIESHHNLASTCELPKTKLEKAMLIKQAMLIQQEEIEDLQNENYNLKLQRESFQKRVNLLIHNPKTYTATELAKEVGLRSAMEFNRILEEKEIQYKVNKTWVLTANYSELGYGSIKTEELGNGLVVYNLHWTGEGREFILNLFKESI
jgi:hypothetical protein